MAFAQTKRWVVGTEPEPGVLTPQIEEALHKDAYSFYFYSIGVKFDIALYAILRLNEIGIKKPRFYHNDKTWNNDIIWAAAMRGCADGLAVLGQENLQTLGIKTMPELLLHCARIQERSFDYEETINSFLSNL